MTKMRKAKIIVVRYVTSTPKHPSFGVLDDSKDSRAWVKRMRRQYPKLEAEVIPVWR